MVSEEIRSIAPGKGVVESFKQALEKAAVALPREQYRFLIVSEPDSWHMTVAGLLWQALSSDPEVDFEVSRDTITLDTVDNPLENAQRYLASLRFGTGWMRQQELDFGRWRFQRFVALLARKRVEAKLKLASKEGRPYDAIAFQGQNAALACIDLMAHVPALVSIGLTNAQASREWNIPATRWTYWPAIRWERAVFRQARAVATFSGWAMDAVLAENPRLDPGKVRHYAPGIELEQFLELPVARQRVMSEFDATASFGRYVAWLKEIGKKKS
ncbi:MAG TPA: hypothetical protein V6C52_04600 [Coleofasciculaceae cyanobacterium]